MSYDMNPTDYEKLLVTETPDALFVVSPDVRVLYWNHGAETTFGYTSEEAVGRSLYELILPPDEVAADEEFQREALTKSVANRETLRRRKDGSLIYVNVYMRAVSNAQGK